MQQQQQQSNNNNMQQNDTNNNYNYKSNDTNTSTYSSNEVKSTSVGEGASATKDALANAQRVIELICSDQVLIIVCYYDEFAYIPSFLFQQDSQRPRDELENGEALDMEGKRRPDHTVSRQVMTSLLLI